MKRLLLLLRVFFGSYLKPITQKMDSEQYSWYYRLLKAPLNFFGTDLKKMHISMFASIQSCSRLSISLSNLKFCIFWIGGAFDSNQAFYGKMSRVNVWSYVLSTSVIKEMAKGCGLWSGDAIAWFHFKSSTFGAVQVVKPSSCSLAGEYAGCPVIL